MRFVTVRRKHSVKWYGQIPIADEIPALVCAVEAIRLNIWRTNFALLRQAIKRSFGLLCNPRQMGLRFKLLLSEVGHSVHTVWKPGPVLAGAGMETHGESRLQRAIRTVMEPLESRILYSWTGATSGSTNDSSHDYNNVANWSGGVINDDFSASTLTSNTTIYFSASRTTTAGMNLGYAGNFDLTFKSSSGTARTLTLSGNITGDFGGAGNGRVVTIGDATNTLNVNLGAATRTLTANTSDTLSMTNVVSNGGITKAGGGTLTLTGANTYASGTTINAGTVSFANTSLGSGNITFGASSTLQWNGANTQDVSNNIQAIGTGVTATFDTQANNVTLASIISGLGGIAKAGSGTLTLSAANTYSGGTAVNVGTLQATNGAGGTSSITPTPFGDTTTTVTVASGATVWLDYLLVRRVILSHTTMISAAPARSR